MNHTPEPWQVSAGSQDYTGLCNKDKSIGTGISQVDARRIVACVNACAGIPTESLESGRLEEMRDSLFGAYVDGENNGGAVDWAYLDDTLAMARNLWPGQYEQILDLLRK